LLTASNVDHRHRNPRVIVPMLTTTANNSTLTPVATTSHDSSDWNCRQLGKVELGASLSKIYQSSGRVESAHHEFDQHECFPAACCSQSVLQFVFGADPIRDRLTLSVEE
jgi:hypothetical protein